MEGRTDEEGGGGRGDGIVRGTPVGAPPLLEAVYIVVMALQCAAIHSIVVMAMQRLQCALWCTTLRCDFMHTSLYLRVSLQ
jgi:hypothetical protein